MGAACEKCKGNGLIFPTSDVGEVRDQDLSKAKVCPDCAGKDEAARKGAEDRIKGAKSPSSEDRAALEAEATAAEAERAAAEAAAARDAEEARAETARMIEERKRAEGVGNTAVAAAAEEDQANKLESARAAVKEQEASKK